LLVKAVWRLIVGFDQCGVVAFVQALLEGLEDEDRESGAGESAKRFITGYANY
jgi:hypothetical protein